MPEFTCESCGFFESSEEVEKRRGVPLCPPNTPEGLCKYDPEFRLKESSDWCGQHTKLREMKER